MKTGDRYVLLSDITTNAGPYSEPISEGTVVTIYSPTVGSTDNVLVRYDTDENTNRPKMITIPTTLLKPASKEQLLKANYKKLIPESFHPDQLFRSLVDKKVTDIYLNSEFQINKNDILTVKKVILEANEDEDLIYLKIKDDSSFIENECVFPKSFVNFNFEKYDPEIEAKIGEEVVMADMKTAPRNYYLPGARMIAGPREKEEIVILIREVNSDLYDVVNIEGKVRSYTKEKLIPITDRQTFLNYPRDVVIPFKYRSGKNLVAQESISNNFLLKNKIVPGDVIEIVHLDAINCNANEDVYEVLCKGKSLNLSYLELEKHFDVSSSENKGEEVKIEGEKIAEEFNKELQILNTNSEIKIMNDVTHFKINDVTIYGFRFKIENSSFSIDGKEFAKDDIDYLIKALGELKEKVL